MKIFEKAIAFILALCLCCGLSVSAFAVTYTDAHGNTIEPDDSLVAYTASVLYGADDAARKAETNLGDLWTDALHWFAVSGTINEYFEEDDVASGNTSIAVDSDHIVALWNGGNLHADVPEGRFGAEQLAEVLPYPNKAAVIYMTGAQLLEALEAASQGLPNEIQDSGEPGGQTRENPASSRKEYDENAPAEIEPGTDRLLHKAGEGNGASAAKEESGTTASQVNDLADETAVQTTAAENAAQMGVSEDADAPSVRAEQDQRFRLKFHEKSCE